MNDTPHPLIQEYLRQFDAEAWALPAGRRLLLREEIEAHLRELVAGDVTDAEATRAISAFGSPAEIIGQELDGQVPPSRARRPRSRRLIAVVSILAAAALAIPAGITLASLYGPDPAPPSVVEESPAGPSRVTEGQAYFEYLAAIEAMEHPLPPGAEYPDGVPERLDAGNVEGGSGGVMESGAGFYLARFTWLCAWESDYLTAFEEKDFKRQVRAEAMLGAWTQSEWFDPASDWAATVISPMKMGDPSGVRQDRVNTCAQAGIFKVRS